MSLSKVTPCLCFGGNAEEAVKFYTSVFKNAKVNKTHYYTKAGQDIHKYTPGDVLFIEFELDGFPFQALNGPKFNFTEAISFSVECQDQAEVDYFYDRLGEDGDETKKVCGELTIIKESFVQ